MKVNYRNKLVLAAGATVLALGLGTAPEPSEVTSAAVATPPPVTQPGVIAQLSPSSEPIAEEPVVEQERVVDVPKPGGEVKPKPAPPAVVVPPVVEVPTPPAEHPRVQYCAETGYANNGACLDAIPATFSTNSLFKSFNDCKRGAAGIHQIGWGGNSRTGLGFAGPWTARVDGPTVSYFACG